MLYGIFTTQVVTHGSQMRAEVACLRSYHRVLTSGVYMLRDSVCGEAVWTGLDVASGSSHLIALLRFSFLWPELTEILFT